MPKFFACVYFVRTFFYAYYIQGEDAWIQVYQIKMRTYKRTLHFMLKEEEAEHVYAAKQVRDEVEQYKKRSIRTVYSIKLLKKQCGLTFLLSLK